MREANGALDFHTTRLKAAAENRCEERGAATCRRTRPKFGVKGKNPIAERHGTHGAAPEPRSPIPVPARSSRRTPSPPPPPSAPRPGQAGTHQSRAQRKRQEPRARSRRGGSLIVSPVYLPRPGRGGASSPPERARGKRGKRPLRCAAVNAAPMQPLRRERGRYCPAAPPPAPQPLTR